MFYDQLLQFFWKKNEKCFESKFRRFPSSITSTDALRVISFSRLRRKVKSPKWCIEWPKNTHLSREILMVETQHVALSKNEFKHRNKTIYIALSCYLPLTSFQRTEHSKQNVYHVTSVRQHNCWCKSWWKKCSRYLLKENEFDSKILRTCNFWNVISLKLSVQETCIISLFSQDLFQSANFHLRHWLKKSNPKFQENPSESKKNHTWSCLYW